MIVVQNVFGFGYDLINDPFDPLRLTAPFAVAFIAMLGSWQIEEEG